VFIEAALEAALAVAARQLETRSIRVLRDYEPAGAQVFADTGQMEQVFLNLFINASHAMENGGTLRIATRYERDDLGEGYVLVEVTDTGVGIRPEDLDRVFEPFFSTKGRLGESDTPGSGLGLSVSRSSVEAHGGTIEVRSTLGEGTSFTTRLPLRTEAPPVTTTAAAQTPAPRQGPSPRAAQERPRLLVADDETDVREIIAEALSMAGFHVVTAATAGEAIAALRAAPFDLVLSDLLMPGGGAKAILSLFPDDHSRPPVVVLTGKTEAYVEEALLAAGAARCLQKPIGVEQLLSSIDEVLRGGSQSP